MTKLKKSVTSTRTCEPEPFFCEPSASFCEPKNGSGSQARALATPKFNQRGNVRAVNVTPRNSKLEVQFRAFRRTLFLRQEILPRFVSLHLVGTRDILLGGRIPFRGEYGNIRSCHGNWDGLRPNGLLGSDAEFTFSLLLKINIM